MEKLGIEQQELLRELQDKYNDLLKRRNTLTKEGAAGAAERVDQELGYVKERIEQLQQQSE